jgi:hypothetical protein
LIDWAMITLNPLEPWPGELCLAAAAASDINVMTRGVECGGLMSDDLSPETVLMPGDKRSAYPAGWIEGGRVRLDAMRPIAERAGLSLLQLACQWNLAHEPVGCVVPTLIQEAGSRARPVEEKRAELAGLPERLRLSVADVEEIRAIGDNTGCMALKGASPDHVGEARADAWSLDARLEAVAQRWSIDPVRDLGARGSLIDAEVQFAPPAFSRLRRSS